MKFTKIESGTYSFEGNDVITGEFTSGKIVFQPYDKKLKYAWEIRFDGSPFAEIMFPSLKKCKHWLTNK